MFRLTMMVDDKNLSRVLRALSGLVRDMEPPQPVVLADDASRIKMPAMKMEKMVGKKPRKQRKPRAAGGATGAELFLRQLSDDQFTVDQLRDFLPAIGQSPRSCSTQIEKMKKSGWVKRIGSGVWGLTAGGRAMRSVDNGETI